MTPDRLKASILQEAITGRLCPQDPEDEPAEKLLSRIEERKAELVKQKKLKPDKSPSRIFRRDGRWYEQVGSAKPKLIDDELPFELPDGWAWVRLGSLGNIVGGGTPKTENPEYWNNATIPWLTPADMKFVSGKYVAKGSRNITKEGLDSSSAQLMPPNSVIYSSRAPIGYVAIAKNELCTNQGFKSLVPIYTEISEYIYYCLIALTDEIKSRASGTTFKEISGTEFGKTLIPLPPLAEQKRIVEKVERLLPLVGEYAAAYEELERLDAGFGDAMKRSVLQEAVTGRLCPQNPEDEPAEKLLSRIEERKAELVKQKKLKPDKSPSKIFRRGGHWYEQVGSAKPKPIDDELPFELPDGWAWCRLRTICTYIQRGKSPKYSPIKKYPVIAQKCNQWSGFSIEKAQFIDPETISSYDSERFLKDNDLLWNSTGLGTLGRIVAYKSELNPFGVAVADSHVTVIRVLQEYVSSEYLRYYFSNPSVQSIIEDLASGSTKQKELATETIREYLIPLPPLAEQKRIVEKVDKLLVIIQDL